MDRRGVMIGTSGLLAAWTMAGTLAFGQAARPAAGARQQGAAPAQAAQDQAAPAAPNIDVETLLRKWEEQSSKLKTLDVSIFRRDDIPEFDEIEYYEGRAIFKNPNLAFINFKKIKQDAGKKPAKKADGSWDSIDDERIVCTGNEVVQFKSDTGQIFVYPLEKDQAAKAIEEGPLPFLFNMKAEEAKQRYTIEMIKAPDANSYAVSIIPKLDVDRESFSKSYVLLDSSFILPIQIILYAPTGKGTKNFRLNPVKPNVAVNDENFTPNVAAFAAKGWKVVHNPMGENRPRNAPGTRPPGAPAGNPAARPAAAAPASAARTPGAAPRR
ncbi:hypothetical protein [Paludisphaera rhizosphaerae]|uniref:hypothetical protein n=1 Tax=Paludisphaera rhizosphaerae TaxID=2711216 RepID=UPI0013EA8C35|nr:hypothetical protein [Paludisphaera rhizosphaerae]